MTSFSPNKSWTQERIKLKEGNERKSFLLGGETIFQEEERNLFFHKYI